MLRFTTIVHVLMMLMICTNVLLNSSDREQRLAKLNIISISCQVIVDEFELSRY